MALKAPVSIFHPLRIAIPNRRHISSPISPSSAFQLQFRLQILWSSVSYASSIASNGNSFTVSYPIDSSDFSPQEAEAASEPISSKTPDVGDLVIKSLKSHGFSELQILRLIKRVPELVRSDNAEEIFLRKIRYFKSIGVSSSRIPRLICAFPDFLRNEDLIPSFNFLRDLFQSDEGFIKAIEYCPSILRDPKTTVVAKIELLVEAGVPRSNTRKYLLLFNKSLHYDAGIVNEAVKEVKELGFDPLKFQFLAAVHICTAMKKSTRAKKADLFKKWGMSDNDILTAFKKFALCMALSEDQLEAKLEILVNQLGCSPSSIAKYPTVLGYSLKKRIVPRAAVLQVLLSRGLIKGESVIIKFYGKESSFRDWLVLNHGQSAAEELWELYGRKMDQDW